MFFQSQPTVFRVGQNILSYGKQSLFSLRILVFPKCDNVENGAMGCRMTTNILSQSHTDIQLSALSYQKEGEVDEKVERSHFNVVKFKVTIILVCSFNRNPPFFELGKISCHMENKVYFHCAF